MGRIVVSQFITVDGVVEDPGGAEDFERGGWAFRYERGDEGDRFKYDELMASDALLLGRITYEGFAQAWPSRSGDEFSDTFNAIPKYVVSSTLRDPSWNNSHVISFDDVARIKGEGDGNLVVHGSLSLARSLGTAGLVDEWRLMVFPTVLGSGKRLFEGAEIAALRLVETRAVGDAGVLVSTYVA
jgi:dihydrofolate reductase